MTDRQIFREKERKKMTDRQTYREKERKENDRQTDI